VALPITFLSDYGYDDEFAGVCRAVIARITPDVTVIDLTHGIARHDVAGGALVLAATLPYTPAGVHLGVVDPGVGSPRRALAVRVAREERILVGPDNGLLWPAIERFGGPVEAVDVSLSSFRLEPISATFHGRDIFAPVAANLARGAVLREAGESVDPSRLERLERPPARLEAGVVSARVVRIDRFGNAILGLAETDVHGTGLMLGHEITIEAASGSREAIYARAFAEVPEGKPLVYLDS
jgi:S-adenosylmethionine hydrolase